MVSIPDEPRLIVVDESESSMNRRFRDTATNEILTRDEVADRIENGQYPGYNVMHRNGQRYPRANPDGSKSNNLG